MKFQSEFALEFYALFVIAIEGGGCFQNTYMIECNSIFLNESPKEYKNEKQV